MSELSKIAFHVVFSPETNDHEVRVLINDEDILAKHAPDMLGLDPDDFLDWEVLAPMEVPHQEIVARCSCGVIGCGNATVVISQIDETVTWDHWNGDMANKNPGTLTFHKSSYIEAVSAALTDHNWETPDRTAARLLKNTVDSNALATHSLEYQWASGRIQEGKLTISLAGPPGYHQILVHVPWLGETPGEVAEKASAILKMHPCEWQDVTWYGQLAEPPFHGKAWK